MEPDAEGAQALEEPVHCGTVTSVAVCLYGFPVATVLYPGSFDPIHPQKGEPLFSLEEREAILNEVLGHLDNVRITMFSNLVVDLAQEVGADFIVKGLRAVSDFESELQMAQMNHAISGVDTLFIPSASTHSFLASKLIREIARFGGNVDTMVPVAVAKRLQGKYER